LPRRGIDARKR